jgi:hypothetical protein
MVYAFTQDVPIDTDMYARITEALGDEPMDGLLLHLAVRNPDGGLRYIDVWETEEQCTRAFDERVHPASTPPSADGARRSSPSCTGWTSWTCAARRPQVPAPDLSGLLTPGSKTPPGPAASEGGGCCPAAAR